ncbi:MAG: ferrochelatase, partial [Gammaproteobacteria bacterium]|nr:ferrochelatase [Gammaproteobacteria bacterium]
MKYLNESNSTPSTNNGIGILLVNLGTPDGYDTPSVRRYLKEFLSDPRVVEAPKVAWWLFLNLILLNTRPKKSAKAYQTVWTNQGSPLLNISNKQSLALQQQLDTDFGQGTYNVELGMCYGSPSIPSAMLKLKQAGANKLLVLPLYPQYSATTTAAVFDAVSNQLKTWRVIPEFRMVNHYYSHNDYINALAKSIKDFWSTHPPAEKLIMSFHGIPQEYIDKGDPYANECKITADLLAKKLNLNPDQWMLTFQSRLGPKQWLEPYTDLSLADLAKNKGVKSVQMVCPGFSVDCLETLEEIAMENKDTFIENGGEHYEYIDCLNETP